MKVAAGAGEAAIDGVTRVKAATVAEAAEMSSAVVETAVVVKTVAMVIAADVATTVHMSGGTVAAVIQAGQGSFP